MQEVSYKDALLSIADYSIIKKTGARGLRSILENILLETMYELPSIENLEEVVINSEVVKNKSGYGGSERSERDRF